jgi:hypothetical protein
MRWCRERIKGERVNGRRKKARRRKKSRSINRVRYRRRIRKTRNR